MSLDCMFMILIQELNIFRWTPYGTTKCTICKQQVHQNAKYCHTCAYTKGKNRITCSVYIGLMKLVPSIIIML